METQEMEAGAGLTPTIEQSSTVYRYDTQIYINDPSDDLHQLKNNQLIRHFANVKPDLYALIKATNPTLLIFIDLAKKIVEAEG